jgi:hypothetical protein
VGYPDGEHGYANGSHAFVDARHAGRGARSLRRRDARLQLVHTRSQLVSGRTKVLSVLGREVLLVTLFPTGRMSMSDTMRRAGPATAARVCTIISFVFAAIAVLFFPIIFGVAAIVLSIVGYSMGDRALGKWAIAAAIVGTILGFVLGFLVYSAG